LKGKNKVTAELVDTGKSIVYGPLQNSGDKWMYEGKAELSGSARLGEKIGGGKSFGKNDGE